MDDPERGWRRREGSKRWTAVCKVGRDWKRNLWLGPAAWEGDTSTSWNTGLSTSCLESYRSAIGSAGNVVDRDEEKAGHRRVEYTAEGDDVDGVRIVLRGARRTHAPDTHCSAGSSEDVAGRVHAHGN